MDGPDLPRVPVDIDGVCFGVSRPRSRPPLPADRAYRSADVSIQLGAFRLGDRIGHGGMADVWAAVHVDTGVEVAVKLIRRDPDAAAFRADALRNEVRALARLDHEAIVPVLDQGEVSAETALASDGQLVADTPYFVMLRTNGGTLDDAPLPTSFDALRAVLVRVLRALAHAHARGVLHRDVKPSNVLLHDNAGGSRALLLSDFGIAHALRSGDRDGPPRAGTPAYMAPEQIAGLVRDEGAPTDLYSVGCLVHRLVSGSPPFSGAVDEIRRAHVLAPLPALAAPWPMPRALAEWTATLLAKRPSQRFPGAAAALAALYSIDASDTLAPSAARRQAPRAASTEQPTVASEAMTLAPAPGLDAGARRPSLWPRAKVSPTWRAFTAPRASQRLVGAGLGLYGLRPVPLANRDHERDRLWESLVDVVQHERARVVVLRGPAGLGKTRLAEWLIETAEELGAASTLSATHGPSGGPLDGIPAMLHRRVRAAGLSGEALLARTAHFVHELGGPGDEREDAEDLAAILEDRHDRFEGPRERHAAIRRVLVRLAARTPLVVVLDDAVLGQATLAFVEALAAGPERLATLFVLTARDEDLAERPEAAASLARIAASPLATELRVELLGTEAHGELVEELLGLETDVAREVRERTLGNPLFAVQLVGDWVQRRVLVPGPQGFRRRDGASAEIPDDIHGVWRARVDRALAQLGGDASPARGALELAAALGTRVERSEWAAACAASGLPVPDALLDALAGAGLVRAGGTSVLFVHNMLRESVERAAAEAGRLREHHRALAKFLEERGADPERVAHHHLAAGALPEALPALLAAATRALEIGDAMHVRRLTDLHRTTLDRLGADASDAGRARGELFAAEALVLGGLLDDAERVVGALDTYGVVELKRRWLLGLIAQKRGNAAGALASFDAARGLATALGDRVHYARCLYGAAECEKLLGHLDEARSHYEQAGAIFGELGQLAFEARVLTGLSDVEGRRGRLDRALELAERSRGLLERLGARSGVAIALNGTGDLLRKLGRLDEAEASYREALRILTDLATREGAFVRLNLGLVALARGDLAGADVLLEEVETEMRVAGRQAYVQMVRAMRLASAAAAGAWLRFDACADDAERTVLEGGVVDPDLASALDRAADEALARGERERARRVAAIAATQWSRLGYEAAAARAAARGTG